MKKNNLNILGFITALLMFTSIVMNINHLPGARIAMVLSGMSLSIYLPFFLLSGSIKGPVAAIGAFAGGLISLGIIFKFQHWPGTGVMLVLGLTSLALVLVPLLLLHQLRDERTLRKIIMNISGAVGLILFSLGILFRIMHWPGAAIMLPLSLPFLFLGYFLLYLLDRSIDAEVKAVYLRKAFFTMIIGGILATCIVLNLRHPFLNSGSQQGQAAAVFNQ